MRSSIVRTVPRARRCGWLTVSSIDSTGAAGTLCSCILATALSRSGKVAEPILDQLDHLGAIREAARVGAELRVVDQFRPVHRGAEILPMMQERHDDDPSAGRLEDARRADVVQMRPLAARLHLTIAAAVLMNADFVAMVVNVEQADIEMLPLAGAIAIAQRRQHRQRAMHARADVADADQRNIRSAARLTDHRGDAGIGLRDKVVAGQMMTAVRSGPARRSSTG